MDKIYNDLIGYIITFLDEKSIIFLGMTSKKFHNQYLKYLKSINPNSEDFDFFLNLFRQKQYIKLKLFYKDVFVFDKCENEKIDLIYGAINTNNVKLAKLIFKVSNNNIKTRICDIIAKETFIYHNSYNELYNFLRLEIKKYIPNIDINTHLYPGYKTILLHSKKFSFLRYNIRQIDLEMLIIITIFYILVVLYIEFFIWIIKF